MALLTQYRDLGLMEYGKAWDYQENLLQETLQARKNTTATTAGTLLLCEHPHVYTLGKSGQLNNLLIQDEFLQKIHATYYRSNRGGDITYHGPGQLVGYPIFDLEALKLGVKQYINLLEEAIIQTLAQYSISAGRLEGATGVWLDAQTPMARKICAIGVRVSKAVTMHGFALNVNTDLCYFAHINPCGFIDKGVTSMQKELGQKQDMEAVKQLFKEKTTEVFRIQYA